MSSRRPLGSVLKKAPQALWQQHRARLLQTEFSSFFSTSTSSAPPPPLVPDSSVPASRRAHLQRFANPSFSVRPVRNDVIPLPLEFNSHHDKTRTTTTTTASSSSSSSSTATQDAHGFIWPLYKPPHFSIFDVDDFVKKEIELVSSNEEAAAAAESPFSLKSRRRSNTTTNNNNMNSNNNLTLPQVPYRLALSWYKNKSSSSSSSAFFYASYLSHVPQDVGGVVPVLFMFSCYPASSWKASSPPLPPRLPHVSAATFEAVLEGHIPRRTKYDNKKFLDADVDEDDPLPPLHDPAAKLKVNFATVVRHGYYLQQPVTVVRWELGGHGCASEFPPRHVIPRIFSPPPNAAAAPAAARAGGARGFGRDASSSSSSSSSSLRVVGDPRSPLTQQLDIASPMVLFRGLVLSVLSAEKQHEQEEQQKDENRNSMTMSKNVVTKSIVLPNSPFASEEMISSPPPRDGRIAKASIMDGIWTP